MGRRINTGDPRHHAEDIVRLQDEVNELKRLVRSGAVVTHLGQVNLELRQLLGIAATEVSAGGGTLVCETCDCPLVLEGETRHCRTCQRYDWLAH